MADKKISQLTAATTPLAGTEVVPVVQSGSTVKVAVSDLTAGRAASMLSATLTGGTVNGVLYLNASKAATSGSALVFDGTNLGIGTASPAVTTHISAASGGAVVEVLRLSNSGGGANTQAQLKFTAAATNYGTITGGFGAAAPQMTFDLPGAGNYVWQVSGTERMRLTTNGNIVAGGSVALATTATNGFLYVPTCAGTPTGTPTAITGMVPIVVDTTNNKLYFYSTGVWRDAGP
jgi:hypothetical protein